MSTDAAIGTWFVADDVANATFFPQVGSRSDAPEVQAVYWRCVACFFASSIAVNAGARHVFYTNTRLPVIDGIAFSELFERWGVEVVTLPITYRLPAGSVSSWGNQFYIFDVIDHYAASGADQPLIVLDSDCIWIKNADAMVAALRRNHALTYDLGEQEYPPGSVINGLTLAELGSFVTANGGPKHDAAPYFGGEIYAASAEANRKIAARARALWPVVQAQGPCAPREEAHFLSALYAMEAMQAGTANPFIRRMWTTFHFHNLAAADRDLTIWHLPAEKRTGFADMFALIMRDPALHPARDAAAMGLTRPDFDRLMGFPRRGVRKFLRDLSLKVREKLAS